MEEFDSQGFIARINQRLEELNLSPRAASLKAGASPDLIRGLQRGMNKSIRGDHLVALAKVLKVSESWLVTGRDAADVDRPISEGIRFGGIVEAGTFRRINIYNQDAEYQLIPLLPNPAYPADRQFAYRVEGDSMNLEHIMPGMWIHAVEVHTWEHFHGAPNDRELVIVEAKADGDDERRELTVKMLRIFRDRVELHPCSSNPAHQKYVIPYKPPEDYDDTVHVIAVVLSSTWLHRYKGP